MTDRDDLGVFLRNRRERVAPEALGLPGGRGRRRTPGLRREELATLAGVSVDYYTRLEQGRERRPSAQVVHALQRALRLDADERAYLDALVRRAAGTTPPGDEAPGALTATQLQVLDALRPAPAYLLSRVSDVLAANPEGYALLPGLAEEPPERRNTMRYLFTHPAAAGLFGDRDGSRADNVAHLRTVLARDPDAADVAALVAELSADVEFAALWARGDVRRWSGRAKTFHHPVVGELRLDSESFTLPDGGRRLVVYQAVPGSADAAALERLA